MNDSTPCFATPGADHIIDIVDPATGLTRIYGKSLADVRVTEEQKRSIACPRCGARKGRACRGSRIPGPNSFGGGWGGPPDLDRVHDERRTAFVARQGFSFSPEHASSCPQALAIRTRATEHAICTCKPKEERTA